VTIAVLDYGSGNLRSVAHALERVGGDVAVTGSSDDVMRADGLVVPGVGHFGACMTAIRERGLEGTITSFIATGRPVFAVCVGMQILFENSDEAPDVRGLGVFHATVERLATKSTVDRSEKVPNMGWSRVTWTEPIHRYASRVFGRWFYFAHSYAATIRHPVGHALHGTHAFAAAVAHENVFATQFHPEKSGNAGLALYAAFAEEVAA
jgi:imidazole glycerol-phosphate synthase subunit HisH